MAEYLKPIGNVIHEGIDVSVFQGSINFQRVREAGKTAVYIRSSLGSNYVDPNFRENYQNARANGLLVGFYHYVTARSTDEARQQARFFVDTVRGKQMQMRLAMDYEHFDGQTDREINDIAHEFMDELVTASGKEAVVYTGAYHAKVLWDQALADKYPLWVADYGAVLPEYNDKWRGWVGFQYSDKGEMGGIRGRVDLDRFTEGILLSDTSSSVPCR